MVELPRTHAPVATEPAITPADLMTRLYIIADDSMQGREAGTIGNVKVTNYVAREMERMGLRPGGENGTYFQTVPVIISRIDSTRTIVVDGTPLGLGTDVLPFYAPLANRLLPMGATTRSLDGVQAVYGGQLGGTLIDPAASCRCPSAPTAGATGASSRRGRSPAMLTPPESRRLCSTSCHRAHCPAFAVRRFARGWNTPMLSRPSRCS